MAEPLNTFLLLLLHLHIEIYKVQFPALSKHKMQHKTISLNNLHKSCIDRYWLRDLSQAISRKKREFIHCTKACELTHKIYKRLLAC